MARALVIWGITFLAVLLSGGSPAYASDARYVGTSQISSNWLKSGGGINPKVARYRERANRPSTEVKRAIWDAALRTGVDYEYLLAKAHLESGLNPKAKAKGSSASGLFQFIESTWFRSLKKHGVRYGVEALSGQAPRQEVLNLRNDPKAAALMAAAYAMDNEKALRSALGRSATHAELYLAHFLGTGGATRFVRSWARDPRQSAAALFPDAARANRPIFYTRAGAARSLDQVLRHFDAKMRGAIALTQGSEIKTADIKPNSCNHIVMCYMAAMDTSTITRVRELVTSGEFTKAGLARAAGLHANTLRDAADADWNPTADTLAKLQAFLDSNDDRPVLVGADEIINEARNGRMYILVDDEDRENEGDLIIPAQMATPDAINFMATHGRGLVCLALDKDRVDRLGLQPMTRNNTESMQTAFTISIEAKEGVTTGISAADRARTVSVAIDATKGPDDIVMPGHVFPLTARDGGVLVRAGHTEAAVDISRLAGLNPSGVICEIMNEDGTMARLDDLVGFARKHDLKIGTIRDLIEYRMRHDHLVKRVSDDSFESDYGGQWRMLTYRNKVDGGEHYVLQKGHVLPDTPTLTRVHPISIFDDVLGQPGERKRTLQRAMQAVGEHGSGIIVIITGRRASGSYSEEDEVRNVGIGSQILADLDVHDMILLSNSQPNVVAIEGYGLDIVDHMPIPG